MIQCRKNQTKPKHQNTTVILVHKKSDSILENSPGIEDRCSEGITKYNQEQNQKGNLTEILY